MAHHLIIGGAGFVGSHAVERLLHNGHHVTVSDLIPSDSARNLGPYIDNIKYSWKSAEDLESKDFEGVDSVIFLASQADVPLALSSPRYTFHRNILGLVNVLELLRSRPKTRLIYLSSKNVYGIVPPARVPITEDEPLNPADPYGASKAAADLACLSYANAYDMPITVLRSGGVFGPRSRLKQVVPIFIRQALANKPITIEGDGSQVTDLNYVGNLVDAITSAAENGEKGVYNIAYGKDVSILELANEIIAITKSKSKIIFVPWRPGEKGLRLVLSIEKAKRELGYDPKISLNEGLQKTVEWLRGLG
ncbi:MAG: NAD-dependent epimerase/dehydratase family protein [Thaumarchaeota archaeon]|nr:NAD-dependent epimerase/dehydratase family protein [Nitrososphaerota archaeon]